MQQNMFSDTLGTRLVAQFAFVITVGRMKVEQFREVWVRVRYMANEHVGACHVRARLEGQMWVSPTTPWTPGTARTARSVHDV